MRGGRRGETRQVCELKGLDEDVGYCSVYARMWVGEDDVFRYLSIY